MERITIQWGTGEWETRQVISDTNWPGVKKASEEMIDLAMKAGMSRKEAETIYLVRIVNEKE